MTYKLLLNEKQLIILSKHWDKNLEYGWNGTFGGYDDSDKEGKRRSVIETRIGWQISKKLLDIRIK